MKRTNLRIILVPVLVVTFLMLSLEFGPSQAVAVMESPDPAPAGFCMVDSQTDAGELAKGIVGAKTCTDCHDHKLEGQAWRMSSHYQTIKKRADSDEAWDILEKLKLDDVGMKKQVRCMKCHTTVQLNRKKKPVAKTGISCESCHGPAQDWLDPHSTAGKPASGMIRPGDVYALANNCLTCHTGPGEELVNVGGHTAGSDFELVAWSQGKVRHNTLREPGKNREASVEKKRKMYVVGRMLDLAHALSGYAQVTDDQAKYAVAMKKRITGATAELRKIADNQKIDEVTKILELAPKPDKIALEWKQELQDASRKVAGLARKFAETGDGSKLQALDALVPTKFIGEAFKP